MDNRVIFVLEDEPTISRLIQIKLEKKFQTVRTYFNGKEGFEAIKKEKPDVIILDLMLPGMHGFEILESIKKDPELCDIKVLILSARAREEDIERGFKLHADEYMEKPFKMNELHIRVNKLID